MGLLDDLLSTVVAGQAAGSQRRADTSQSHSTSGSDMSRILMALLPVVLAMLSQRRGDAAPASNRPSAGAGLGGLGDLVGSLLGGAGETGGLGDLLAQFQRAGLGQQAQSWVGRGQNEPLSSEGVERVFGPDALAQIARHAGISEADASRGLSQLLPEVVDRVTPDGQVPDDNQLLAGVDSFARRYGLS